MKIQCCACLRIRENGGWNALEQPKVLEQDVSHGYCPACAEKAFAELRAQQRAERSRQTPVMLHF